MSLIAPTRFYLDDMNHDEVAFLARRLKNEKRKFGKSYKVTFFLSLAVVIMIAILMYVMHLLDPKQPDEDQVKEITPALILEIAGISFLGIFAVFSTVFMGLYYQSIFLLSKDIRRKIKIVEQANIVDKKYMPHNDTYHLILDSPKRYTMEVDRDFYHSYHIGDEVNLEYARFTKIDFGYF